MSHYSHANYHYVVWSAKISWESLNRVDSRLAKIQIVKTEVPLEELVRQ